MILAERHIIKKDNTLFKEMDNLCFLSKNLYNAGLYMIRQHFFKTKKMLNYSQVQTLMVNENNVDFRALPAKVSQQTLKVLEKNFKGFFEALKSYSKNPSKFKARPKPPKYLEKNGRFSVFYTDQAIYKSFLKKGIVKLSKSEVMFKPKNLNVRQVRLIHRDNYIVIELLYEQHDIDLKPDNGRYCSMDLGLNNLVTMGSNVLKPIIISGKPLKSINHFYNKHLAKLKSNAELKHNIKTNKRIKRLHSKRYNKVQDYLHKTSRLIVNHLVSNNINTLVIGNNKNWKQDINIGSKNNQNFVQIPHTRFIQMISYKCKLQGINVIVTEESYTSKCSFMDSEQIKKHSDYKGKRIKRGLFKTATKKLINADLNGSLNILRKVIGEFQYPIKVCSTPLVLTIK